jgi:CubicO group peptidase (beta-lactamase class C family)
MMPASRREGLAVPIEERSRSPLETSRREVLRGSVVGIGSLAGLSLGRGRAMARSASQGLVVPIRRTHDLDSFIRDEMRVAHLPGLSALVTKDLDVTWAKGYGWANREEDLRVNPHTVSMLASISKTVICAAAMQLWESGSLDLDADINDYLPFPVRNPHHPHRAITARMLLTHTSSISDRYSLWGTLSDPTPEGYTHGDATISLHDILEGYLVPGGPYYIRSKNFYGDPPGARYRYSNIAADVAALLVEEISGTPFGQYCTDNIFIPLGMSQTGYHLADISTPNLMMPYRYRMAGGAYTPYYQYGYPDYPCGALRTSAQGLSRWLRCFINFGALDGTRVLKRSTVKEIRRPQIPGTWWQGLIWYYRSHHGRPLLGHNGSDYGVSTSMFFESEASRPTGVIMLGNRYFYSGDAWHARVAIEDRLFDLA